MNLKNENDDYASARAHAPRPYSLQAIVTLSPPSAPSVAQLSDVRDAPHSELGPRKLCGQSTRRAEANVLSAPEVQGT